MPQSIGDILYSKFGDILPNAATPCKMCGRPYGEHAGLDCPSSEEDAPAKASEYTFWACWVKGNRSPTFQHRTADDAQKEAERLARLPENVGKPVFVLKAESFALVELPPCSFTETAGIAPKADGIPF